MVRILDHVEFEGGPFADRVLLFDLRGPPTPRGGRLESGEGGPPDPETRGLRGAVRGRRSGLRRRRGNEVAGRYVGLDIAAARASIARARGGRRYSRCERRDDRRRWRINRGAPPRADPWRR